jgi:ATP-binding cassette, subfamily B, bacterial
MRNNLTKNEDTNPLLYLFRKMLEYSPGNKKRVFRFWGMFIVANLIALIIDPLIIAQMFTIITSEGVTESNFKTLLLLLGATLVVDVVFWAFHGPARVQERANSFGVRAQYRKHLLKGVLTLPLKWHTDHHSGDTIDKIEKGANALYDFSGTSFETINSAITLIVSYGMLIYLSPSSALIVLGVFIVSILITMRFDKVIIQQYKALNHAENAISESVVDTITNITTVVILRVERLLFRVISKKIEDPFALFKQHITLNEIKWFLTNMCCGVMIVLVLGIYFFQNIGVEKGLLAGTLYLLFNYLREVSDLFYRFTMKYGDMLNKRSKVSNSEELAEDFIEEEFTNHTLPTNWKTLSIENLTFSYENGEGPLHLEDISLTIEKGKRIALIGETGSGKTTFLKVLGDLYHPKDITLSVDGTLLKEGFGSIGQAIALVPQDPEILSSTVRENITLHAPYDDVLIEKYVQMACFGEVLSELPLGLATPTKENGADLSTGQRQRLALTRGLLLCHDKDILLLDEPTSNLDPIVERKVYENIFEGYNGKTIISTIHRYHLLPLFDNIYVFDKGRIIESGTFSELIASSEKFRVMCGENFTQKITN